MAFAYWGATVAPVIVAAWQDPADDQARIQWVWPHYEATHRIQRHAATSTSCATTIRSASHNHGGNYQRLVEIKRAYHPGHPFHHNQKIKP
jgi:hypothetical protein